MTILAVCLAAVALSASIVMVTLGVIGYRRLGQELIELEDRLDELASTPNPQEGPSTPASLYDHRPEET